MVSKDYCENITKKIRYVVDKNLTVTYSILLPYEESKMKFVNKEVHYLWLHPIDEDENEDTNVTRMKC